MSNTYTQLHVQLVFATKFRAATIDPSWKEALHKYVTGIFHKNKHKMLQINTMPDHMHALIGLHTDQSIASITQNLKSESSKSINEKKLTSAKFCLAGRLRRIFVFQKPYAPGGSIYSRPGTAPSEANVFRRIQIVS